VIFNVSKPTAIFAGLSTITLAGVVGVFLNSHSNSSSDQKWVFWGLVANFLFQIYREYRQRRLAREEARAKAESEEKILRSMRTRVSDFSERLNKIVIEEEQSYRRRAEDARS
jgi:Rps23 Pro-64 3,4-dihydroxylase Tpa1-like proline 4-hydroxylase